MHVVSVPVGAVMRETFFSNKLCELGMKQGTLGIKVTAESVVKLEYVDLTRQSVAVEGISDYFMSFAAFLTAGTWQCLDMQICYRHY